MCGLRSTFKYKNGRLFRGNSEAGWLQQNGYRMVSYKNKKYLTHRVIWYLLKGKWPDGDIDHINGNRQDNRIENLRDVNNVVNLHNVSKPNIDNQTSGFRGVHRHSQNGNWISQITFKKRVYHIGVFDCPKKAHEAYLRKKKELLDA